jgi:hypothetical protein
MTLINWLLNPKMHANTYYYFLNFVWKYDIIFYIFERLYCMHTYKNIFFVFFFFEMRIFRECFLNFLKFQRKTSTLILDQFLTV